MPLGADLKSRTVIRAIVGYGVVAFALLQIVEPIMHGLHLPDVTLTWVLIAIGAAFPVVVIVALVSDRSEKPARLHPGWIATAAIVLLLVAASVVFAGRAQKAPRAPSLSQVTFEGGVEEYPAWSPDGKQLA